MEAAVKEFINLKIVKMSKPRKINGDIELDRAKKSAKKNILCRPNLSESDPKNGFPTTSPIP